MTTEERKERNKYFPKNGVRIILDSLKEVHGDDIKIGESGIRSVLRGTRGDKWGILDQYRIMTDEVKERLMTDTLKRTVNPE